VISNFLKTKIRLSHNDMLNERLYKDRCWQLTVCIRKIMIISHMVIGV